MCECQVGRGTSLLPQPFPLNPSNMKVHLVLWERYPTWENLGKVEWVERGPFPPFSKKRTTESH